MSCDHCTTTVKNLIIFERGVESVEVSLENNSVEIHGKESMNKDHIISSVNLSGTYNAQ
ncbi:MAG: copper chaperone CopZ [Glaciecola sp.]|jgi:copper chaperone CopZ